MPSHDQDVPMPCAAAETEATRETAPGAAASQKDWLGGLLDTTRLSDINLPGTHDSAAISNLFATPYACHDKTITEQLERGIRVLDIRLKIKWRGEEKGADFVTCHGDWKFGSWDLNEFQSFQSVLDECKHFLAAHGTEVVIMILKIDDWGDAKDDAVKTNNAGGKLKSILSSYPTLKSKDLPELGAARGKIVLLSRINNQKTLDFGTPIGWEDNTDGGYAKENKDYRSFKVYVQDRHSFLMYRPISAEIKTSLVWTAAKSKKKWRGCSQFRHCGSILARWPLHRR
jgi:hypothetical protein